MFDRDSARKRATGVAETHQEIWVECFEHKRLRDGAGLAEEQIWNMLINEVRNEDVGPWWKEWMADRWAERLGFGQLSASNDKEGLELLVDIRAPGAED
eukprot:2696698-Alexandrium_andersonii.AAC.1